MKKTLAFAAAALAIIITSMHGEEVPKDLIVPKSGLDPDKAVLKELLMKAESAGRTYYLVEQTPKEGSRDLVLFSHKAGETPAFVAGGSITDVLKRAKAPEIRKQVAEAFVLMERDRVATSNPGKSSEALSRYQSRVKEEAEKGLIPKALKEAYQSQGTLK